MGAGGHGRYAIPLVSQQGRPVDAPAGYMEATLTSIEVPASSYSFVRRVRSAHKQSSSGGAQGSLVLLLGGRRTILLKSFGSAQISGRFPSFIGSFIEESTQIREERRF